MCLCMEPGVSVSVIFICVDFIFCFFFFQAEDGIRDWSVTGVQTCALPIYHDQMCNGVDACRCAATGIIVQLKE